GHAAQRRAASAAFRARRVPGRRGRLRLDPLARPRARRGARGHRLERRARRGPRRGRDAALRGDLALRRGVGDAAARRRDRVPDARRGPARGRADRVPAPGDRAVVVGGAVTGKLLTFRRPGAAPTVSDAALVAACAVGDAEALGALFDLYHAEVERFIGRLAWCPAAELADLVQNTFIEGRRASRA